MKSPQSPHSSSLWVFALSLRVLFRTLPTSAHKSLGYYAPLYGFSVVGLRVISHGDHGLYLLVATRHPVPYQMVELMQWPSHLELQIDR